MNEAICKYTFDINEFSFNDLENGLINEGEIISCYGYIDYIYVVVITKDDKNNTRTMTHIPLNQNVFSEHFNTYEEHKNMKRTKLIDEMTR